MTDALAGLIEGIARMPPTAHVAILALFAGLLGSFINVCIWRIPRGESIVTPRSRCTSCGTVLSVPDLVPVLSYLALRGRCRHCGAAVSPRYMLVELAVISIWVSSYLAAGPSLGFVLCGAAASVAFTLGGIALMRKSLRSVSRGGFTYLTILVTAAVLAIILGPFLTATRTSYLGAEKNREHYLATVLAQERIEELRGIPVRNILSDRQIYIETRRFTDNIFLDEPLGEYARMRESTEFFNEKFGDVYTEQTKLPDAVWEKFLRAYKRYYGFAYELYPAYYSRFRRITRVQDLAEKSSPKRAVKRVIVTVEINSSVTKGKKVELEATLAEY
jgi:hypothetical protein